MFPTGGVGNLCCYSRVIAQYKLFMVQYKMVDFGAVGAEAVNVPEEFLLANQFTTARCRQTRKNVLKKNHCPASFEH